MKMRGGAILALVLVAYALPAVAAVDPASCRTVRFSEPGGWTDIAATTAIASRLLEPLGYQPVTQLLSIPVTYTAMRSRQIDLYLGDWQPGMLEDRKPYLEDGAIEVVRANLQNARYTLAVPAYVAEAGVKSFADLQRFAEKFHRQIFGIEAGNNGNRIVAELIAKNRFGLGSWTLVESSEQGMLSQVDRAIRHADWVVFLGWTPHPMNRKYHIEFLSGGEDTFGPNNGQATAYSNARAGYSKDCPNVYRLIQNLEFNLQLEENMMTLILDEHLDPRAAAQKYLASHPELINGWLEGVVTIDGQPGADAVRRSFGDTKPLRVADRIDAANDWVTGHKIPLGTWYNGLVEFSMHHARGFFETVSGTLGWMINALTTLLMRVSPLVLIACVTLIAFYVHRSMGLLLFMSLSLLLIDNLGYWEATVQTFSLVIFSTVVCVVIGVPMGIAAAHRPRLYQVTQPILDLMQTIPTFVYLIPTLVLFGLGVVPGLISTVIFAIPAPIRLTHLGISSVPTHLLEVGKAFGATPRQLLFKVELPHALPTIMAGVTQCIMLSLSMVVIAALVGADGLGKPVVRALNSVNIPMGFEAGFAIVILAIVLDRVFKRSRRANHETSPPA